MKELIKALAKFQTLVKPVTKDAANPFFKSKYASLDHIQQHIKEPLNAAGLVVIQRNIFDGQLFVETKIMHVDSGEFETSVFPVIVQKNDAQSYGSAVSYARRYSLSGILNLTIQDSDDDGNAATVDTKSIQMLTDDQFNKSLNADAKGIEAVLRMYSGQGYGMTDTQKKALEIKLNLLKK